MSVTLATMPAWIPEGWADWVVGAGIGLGILLAVLIAQALLFLALRRVLREHLAADPKLLRGLRLPVLLVLLFLAVQVAVTRANIPEAARAGLRQVNGILLIAIVVWLVLALLHLVERVARNRYRVDVADNRQARRIHTQLRILTRSISLVVVIVGTAAILMTFPTIRQLGTGLLASAGIAGLILGLAARPTVENLIAGMQIAFSEPITLDDVVVIDGEWGRVEEISATYIVVRIWDERRLIVPFSWILQQPFANWTRRTADILGTVLVYTDYTAPLDAVRAELERIVKGSPKWDGRVCGLQVTGAGERTLELRALVSAADSSRAWDLRCAVREGLVAFLQREHPDCLPRVRAELDRPAVAGTSVRGPVEPA